MPSPNRIIAFLTLTLLLVVSACGSIPDGADTAAAPASEPRQEQANDAAHGDRPEPRAAAEMGFWDELPALYEDVHARYPESFDDIETMASESSLTVTGSIVEIRRGRVFGEEEGRKAVYAELVVEPTETLVGETGDTPNPLVVEILLPSGTVVEADRAIARMRSRMPSVRTLWILRSNAEVARDQGLPESRIDEEQGRYHPVLPPGIVVEEPDGHTATPMAHGESELSSDARGRHFDELVEKLRSQRRR